MSLISIGEHKSLYDMFITFITVFVSSTAGIILGATMVSYMVYDKKYKCEEDSIDVLDTEDDECSTGEEEEDQEEDEDKYCFKFFDKLENLPERELEKEELEELRLKTIEEETPEGKVIMSYNSDTESFWYYADSTIIPYSSLDAVARLYTVTYNCKSICINYREEWEKGKERVIKEKEFDIKRREEEEHKPKPKSIFANFKGYNKKHGSDDDEKKKYYIMTERANKFKYKGKVSEFVKKANIGASVSASANVNVSGEIANSSVSASVSANSSVSASVSANVTANVSGGTSANENSPNDVIEKKKMDYSTFKKMYIEKIY